MKMLFITAIASYEKDIVAILKSSQIHSFSSAPILGHVNHQDPHLEDNWFGSNQPDYQSMLFFSLVADEFANEAYQRIEAFNNTLESKSKIHISILNVTKNN